MLDIGAAQGSLVAACCEAGFDAVGVEPKLTRRAKEVAGLVAFGMTNREIAGRLFISERTVEGHVDRIRNKLGVRSRTEIATWAVEHGLLNS